MGFRRQECWSGLPFASSDNLPHPGIEPVFPIWLLDSLSLSHVESSDHLFCLFCLVTQLCPTHFGPIDCSLPGSSIHWILQARILEWVAMPSSRGSSQPRDWTQVSHVAGRFFTTWATREALNKLVFKSIYCRAPKKKMGQLMLKGPELPNDFQGRYLKAVWGRGCRLAISSWTILGLVGTEVVSSIINLLVSTGLGSTCLWSPVFTWWGICLL